MQINLKEKISTLFFNNLNIDRNIIFNENKNQFQILQNYQSFKHKIYFKNGIDCYKFRFHLIIF